MSQQGIYVLCYRTKLEKLTFNYFKFLSSDRPLAKGCVKMHFLQVECKSSSRSGAYPDLQRMGGQIVKWGFEGGGPNGQGDEVPQKLMTFQRLVSEQNYHVNLGNLRLHGERQKYLCEHSGWSRVPLYTYFYRFF